MQYSLHMTEAEYAVYKGRNRELSELQEWKLKVAKAASEIAENRYGHYMPVPCKEQEEYNCMHCQLHALLDNPHVCELTGERMDVEVPK